VSPKTAWHWLQFLEFKYDEVKRCYYTDGHQRSDALYDQEERFLPKYFKYELRIYRWVQLKEEKAIELENSVQLPKAFYAYEREGEAMREYHVDTHKHLINFVHCKC
jgi:hypothetical protein